MTPVIPWYITLVVLGANLFVAAAVWRLVAIGADRAELPPESARRVRVGTAMGLAVWLGLALLLAPDPGAIVGRDPFYLSPLLPLFALGAAGTLVVALRRSTAFRLALASAPLPALHGVQVYRLIGAIFLVLMAQGQLPAHFARPAGWGDIAIGVSALLVALTLATNRSGARVLAVGWNVIGLLDLVVAVGMGTGRLAPVLAPGLGRVPPAAAMGIFPLIVIPLFVVPVSVILHVVGLARLRRERRARSPLVPRTAP